ncbi:MAG: four helix bundle protein [Terriglobales bacterium]
MLCITSEDYTPEPDVQSYRSHGTIRAKFLRVMNLRGSCGYFVRSITEQLALSSASIGANIAEGCGKRGNNEFQRYLQIAAGSASELDYHLLLARDLGFFEEMDYRRLAGDLSQSRKMLTS